MTTRIFTPSIEKRTITREVTETVEGITNLPPAGTKIRATVGESVLVGVIADHESKYEMFYLEVKGGKYAHLNEFAVWLDGGWTFEILDDAKVEVAA